MTIEQSQGDNISRVGRRNNMTCIVGVEADGRTYIGADSAAVAGLEVRETKLPKVFDKSPFVIGYTDSFRMGQILQHQLDVAMQGSESDMEYMVCSFVLAVRVWLKMGGFSEIVNNVESAGFFLVGYKGKLYEVSSDFQVNSFADGVAAIGCGREYALGALRALETMPVRKRVVRALEVAAYYSGGVIGPFSVLESRGYVLK